MSKPWTPEHAVSLELATTLIESQFPELAPITIEDLGIGWDNTAYLVNNAYTFRFPRREIATKYLHYEIDVLPKIADRFSVKIPKPLFFGNPQESYQWKFFGATFVPGISACCARLSAEERIKMAEPLALFMKNLHAIDAQKAQELGAGQDEIHRLEHEVRTPKTLEGLKQLKDLNIVKDPAPFEALAKTWSSIPMSDQQCLVHGDLYCRHILVNEKNEVSGIIDWGDLHYGNPAIDLALVPQFLPKEAHSVFKDTYGTIDDDLWQLAKVRALYSAISILLYAHDTEDLELLEEGKVALGLLKESL